MSESEAKAKWRVRGPGSIWVGRREYAPGEPLPEHFSDAEAARLGNEVQRAWLPWSMPAEPELSAPDCGYSEAELELIRETGRSLYRKRWGY